METLRMTRRTALTTLHLALGSALALVLFTGCPEQPSLQCATERSATNFGSIGFAAAYTLVSGEGNGMCAELLGDIIGVQQFHPNDNGKADFSEGSVALQANAVGSVAQGNPGGAVDPDPEHHLYSIGPYASMEPSGGFCSVPTLSAAVLELPEVPSEVPEGGLPPDGGMPDGGMVVGDAGMDAMVPATDASMGADAAAADGGAMVVDAGPPPFPGQPAMTFRYEWSNLRVRMSPEFPGNAFSADLTVTQDGCTATYEVNAVFPATACGDSPVPGAATDPSAPCDDMNTCTAGECVEGACVFPCASPGDCPTGAACTDGVCIAPADLFCEIEARPELGIAVGAGIASNLPVRCNTDLGLCVLTKPVSDL